MSNNHIDPDLAVEVFVLEPVENEAVITATSVDSRCRSREPPLLERAAPSGLGLE